MEPARPESVIRPMTACVGRFTDARNGVAQIALSGEDRSEQGVTLESFYGVVYGNSQEAVEDYRS